MNIVQTNMSVCNCDPKDTGGHLIIGITQLSDVASFRAPSNADLRNLNTVSSVA